MRGIETKARLILLTMELSLQYKDPRNHVFKTSSYVTVSTLSGEKIWLLALVPVSSSMQW